MRDVKQIFHKIKIIRTNRVEYAERYKLPKLLIELETLINGRNIRNNRNMNYEVSKTLGNIGTMETLVLKNIRNDKNMKSQPWHRVF